MGHETSVQCAGVNAQAPHMLARANPWRHSSRAPASPWPGGSGVSESGLARQMGLLIGQATPGVLRIY